MRTPFIPALGLAALLFTAALPACSGGEDPPAPGPDAGVDRPDSGAPDAGAPDAGVDGGTDAGPVDAGSDAGTPDGGSDAGPGQPDAAVAIPDTLSGFGLFTGSPSDGGLKPVEGNVPYELTTPLFSDYSLKSRTLYVPPGKQARYAAEDVLDLPVGTLITKTFSFPADFRAPDQNVRAIETRVLVRQPSGWEAHPYVWNEEGTEAFRQAGGAVVPVEFIGEDGAAQKFDYLVPSRNQCLKCHHVKNASGVQVLQPIGVKARYLNRGHLYGGEELNQLQHLAEMGKLQALPALDQVPRAPDAFNVADGTLNDRARTYLDINCAHCHNPKGEAGDTSRLFLNHTNTDEFTLGYCKRPGSAGSGVGGEFDIVPGDHSTSILWYRLHTTESGKMMPEIGRTLRHEQGARLIADWIDAMTPRSCK